MDRRSRGLRDPARRCRSTVPSRWSLRGSHGHHGPSSVHPLDTVHGPRGLRKSSGPLHQTKVSIRPPSKSRYLSKEDPIVRRTVHAVFCRSSLFPSDTVHAVSRGRRGAPGPARPRRSHQFRTIVTCVLRIRSLLLRLRSRLEAGTKHVEGRTRIKEGRRKGQRAEVDVLGLVEHGSTTCCAKDTWTPWSTLR